MIYRKYLFPSDNVPEIKAQALVNLGHPVIKDAVREGMEVITPSEIDAAHIAIDVLIDPIEAEKYTNFEAWPAKPKHHFAGWEQTYLNERNERLN
jgi:hypothetical protein